MKKSFDAIAFKHKAQEEIYEEIKDLSNEELVKYFNKAGEQFRRDMEALREKKKKGRQTKKAADVKAKSTRVVNKSKS